MKEIKPHTHRERLEAARRLISIIRKKLGSNLIAVAACGSFARNKDIEYSDLELVAFVKKLPQTPWEIRKIVDGLLIVVVVETKDSYIRKYLEVSDVWYASGSERLSPVLNKKFVQKFMNFKPEKVKEKCIKQVKSRFYQYQEITAKTLNAILEKNREGFPIIFHQMIKELLIILSYLNQTPYTTLGSYVSEARKFALKPDGFDQLVEISSDGRFGHWQALKQLVENVFSDMEQMIVKRQIKM